MDNQLIESELLDKIYSTIIDISGTIPSQEEVENVRKNLPHDIIYLAIQWGVQDTEVRDKIWEFIIGG